MLRVRIKTGERCPQTGVYGFDGYLDGSTAPSPTAAEREIALSKPNVAPLVKSANKACYWVLIRAA